MKWFPCSGLWTGHLFQFVNTCSCHCVMDCGPVWVLSFVIYELYLWHLYLVKVTKWTFFFLDFFVLFLFFEIDNIIVSN